MKKIIRLTESDLTRIVKRVIKEQAEKQEAGPFPIAPGAPMNLYVFSKGNRFYLYYTNLTQKTPIQLDGTINNNSGKGFDTLQQALSRKDAYIAENNKPDDSEPEYGGLDEMYFKKIVKRTIMELDRSTYEKAADAADKKGFSKLGNKFREHGKEFGSSDTVTMSIKKRGNQIEEKEYTILKIDKEPAGYYEGFILRVEDVETGNQTRFMINKFSKPNNMEFYLNGDYPALPSTRSDAKKILKAFKNKDIDVNGIDIKSISYEDTDFE